MSIYTDEEAKLYNIPLHESHLYTDINYTVTRVVGGWIYRYWDVNLTQNETNEVDSGIFVPEIRV